MVNPGQYVKVLSHKTETNLLVELRPQYGETQLTDPQTGANLGTVEIYLGQYRIMVQIPGGEIFHYGYIADCDGAPINALIQLPDVLNQDIGEAVKQLVGGDERRFFAAPPEPPEPEPEYDEEYDEEIYDEDFVDV